MGKLKILVTGKDGQLGYALQKLSENQIEFTWKFTDRSELDITDSINTQSVLKSYLQNFCHDFHKPMRYG